MTSVIIIITLFYIARLKVASQSKRNLKYSKIKGK